MKNPLTRLLYIGVLGLGVSSAMIIENYLSKSNTLWEYIEPLYGDSYNIYYENNKITDERIAIDKEYFGRWEIP